MYRELTALRESELKHFHAKGHAVADFDEAIRLLPDNADFIRYRKIALELKAERDEEKIKELVDQLQPYWRNAEPGHPAERIAAFG